jgi:hypothetical protein
LFVIPVQAGIHSRLRLWLAATMVVLSVPR